MWPTLAEGGSSTCADCGTPVRSYQYRFYPDGSKHYERCVGFAWCSSCRIYVGAMVHVPRDVVLGKELTHLTPDERERLHRSEAQLIKYLNAWHESATGAS